MRTGVPLFTDPEVNRFSRVSPRDRAAAILGDAGAWDWQSRLVCSRILTNAPRRSEAMICELFVPL
jgi:hypothetical protein